MRTVLVAVLGMYLSAFLPSAATAAAPAANGLPRMVVVDFGDRTGSEILFKMLLSNELRMAGFVTLDRSPRFDLRVTGKVEDLPTAGGKARVRVDARMVRPDETVAATWSGTAEGDSTESALKQAAKQASDELVAKLQSTRREEAASGTPLKLTVDGLKRPEELDALAMFLLKEIPGIKSVAQAAGATEKPTFQVRFTGSSGDLASAFSKKRFQGKRFSVTMVDPSGVGVALRK